MSINPTLRKTVPAAAAVLLAMLVLSGCDSAGSITEQNIAVVKRYFEEAINQGNPAIADELIAPGFVKHNNDVTPEETGPELLRTAIRSHLANNDGYRFVLHDTFAAGDKVAVRWEWQSTNIRYGSPRPVVSQGISIFWLTDGKIRELWQTFDIQGFNRQLGFTTLPPAETGQD